MSLGKNKGKFIFCFQTYSLGDPKYHIKSNRNNTLKCYKVKVFGEAYLVNLTTICLLRLFPINTISPSFMEIYSNSKLKIILIPGFKCDIMLLKLTTVVFFVGYRECQRIQHLRFYFKSDNSNKIEV